MVAKTIRTETEDRAVTPVIGVLLMVVVTIVLSAVVGYTALSIAEDSSIEPAPINGYDVEHNYDGVDNHGIAYVEITPIVGQGTDGENLFLVDDNGTRVSWAEIWQGTDVEMAGNAIHLDGYGPSDGHLQCLQSGATYDVVYDDGERAQLLRTIEIDDVPQSSIDECQDGYPPN